LVRTFGESESEREGDEIDDEEVDEGDWARRFLGVFMRRLECTHTHTHTHRERERERERGNSQISHAWMDGVKDKELAGLELKNQL
jgi:hypothetical protein